ncbi:bifunctional riboflavin kinase/FAD synthetase [Chryseobacterium sp. MP_3.2]|uniref:bifunctional riboflavin kinase/FAD synthetase n=1 Tax=Chryseobacterium sp. MP_3.2 TaxID=3071712 RepID=UPI002E016437|nr:riboflavin kinase/FMN adenylyltransferase [Chryseobacterium sp. MP_3.2]
MKIIENLRQYHDQTPLALSIGMFDGVHLGHQKIINQLNEISQKKKLESGLLTFWPHPRTIFSPGDDLKLLSTLEEKSYLLGKHGVQNLFLQEFDEDFRNLTGEEFIQQILKEKLNVKHLIIGHDHTFGKNKSGDFNLLQKMAPEMGFEVEQIEAVNFGEKHISSTQIRNALSSGKIKEANQMLDYHYSIAGKVIHGKKIGRTIGYPTANIEINSLKILPKKGAYIVDVYVKNEHYKGMLSIGTNPTVFGNTLSVEVYILDFDHDIYGEEISVNFRDFLHQEIKFEGLDHLIARLDEDKLLTSNFNF